MTVSWCLCQIKGATILSIMTLRIITFSMRTLSIMWLSIITFSIITFSMRRLSIKTLSTRTLSITSPSVKCHFLIVMLTVIMLSVLGVLMLSVLNAECLFAECLYVRVFVMLSVVGPKQPLLCNEILPTDPIELVKQLVVPNFFFWICKLTQPLAVYLLNVCDSTLVRSLRHNFL